MPVCDEIEEYIWRAHMLALDAETGEIPDGVAALLKLAYDAVYRHNRGIMESDLSGLAEREAQ
jgi:hypothetical protein